MAKGKEQTMIHNAPHRNLKIEERQTSQWPKEKNKGFTMLQQKHLKIEEQTSQWPKEKNTVIHNAPHRNLKIEERQTSQWPKEKNKQ